MIQKLWVYPLKSGAAVPVDTITLGALGLTGDREYLLTDTDGRFLSARADPVIGQIGFDGVAFHRGQQRAPAAIFDSGLAHAPVSIWKREQPAHRADDATNAWFSALLGKPAVLWRLVPDSALHFGDSQPVMVLNQATADAIASALGRPFGPAQLRPNIVLSQGEAFAEASLGTLTFGDLVLEPVEPCTRCKMINLTPGADQYPDELDVSRVLKGMDVDFVAGMHYRVAVPGTLSL